MHLTYTKLPIRLCNACVRGMDIAEIASRSAAKLGYTLKKEQLDAVVGFLSVHNSPHWVGYGKSLFYACFPFHLEPRLLAPPKVVIIAFQQNKNAYRMAPDPSSSCEGCG